MIFILLVLFVAGFFFYPAWLAMAGYGIYLFSSRKGRRDHAVESRINKLVLANKELAVFKDLYFDAARRYAIDKGAQSPEKNAASATVVINGCAYFVTFMREPSGGTEISVRDKRSVEKEIENDLHAMLRNSKVEAYSHSGESNFKDAFASEQFVDSFVEFVDSIGDLKFDKKSDKPSWVQDAGKVQELSSYVMAESTRQGVAPTYAASILLQKEFVSMILACTASAEIQGFDFSFQKNAAAALVGRAWVRLSLEDKIKFMDMPLNDEVVEALTDMSRA